MSSLKNCLLVMQTVLYSLFVNIHRVVFLISKCLKCYQIGRKIFIKGGVVVGEGGAGINKSHNSFQSLKIFFSLLSHVRFKHRRRGQDVSFAKGVFANCRFLQVASVVFCLRPIFQNEKKKKRSSPSTLCISFFWVWFFFPPPLIPSPVLCPPPCPVLCTHCSACSSGETEEIAVLLIR